MKHIPCPPETHSLVGGKNQVDRQLHISLMGTLLGGYTEGYYST